MDKSLEYVRMCEKATQVQARRASGKAYKDGDVVYGMWPNGKPETRIAMESEEYGPDIRGRDKNFGVQEVWLPRQDQLQEMLTKTFNSEVVDPFAVFLNFWYWFQRFDNWGGEPAPYFSIPVQATSMEQLWLAFVMREKYGKEWNGKEWVKNGQTA